MQKKKYVWVYLFVVVWLHYLGLNSFCTSHGADRGIIYLSWKKRLMSIPPSLKDLSNLFGTFSSSGSYTLQVIKLCTHALVGRCPAWIVSTASVIASLRFLRTCVCSRHICVREVQLHS